MEASALQAPVGLAHKRLSIGAPLLRVRSDAQLLALFRAGHDDAFRVIYDRYHQRLFAYARQMLPGSRQDAEDALQDIFVRAYSGLRANDGELALRAWLYRVAHNRCIDELRRPAPPPPEVLELVRPPAHEPCTEAEQRESIRRLLADVQRLPDQQRSALLMRELGGVSYYDAAAALGVSVSAVKSLLVRARINLAQALEARDTDCSAIREELILAHDRGVRPNGMARRHMHDCAGCREFRGQVRGVSKQFAGLAPALGPVGLLAKLLGFGGGAGGSAAAGGGAATAGGAASTGITAASVGAVGAGHVATLLAAAAVAAGGAVEIQHTLGPGPRRHAARRHITGAPSRAAATASTGAPADAPAAAHVSSATVPRHPAQVTPSPTTTSAMAGARPAPIGRPAPAPASPATTSSAAQSGTIGARGGASGATDSSGSDSGIPPTACTTGEIVSPTGPAPQTAAASQTAATSPTDSSASTGTAPTAGSCTGGSSSTSSGATGEADGTTSGVQPSSNASSQSLPATSTTSTPVFTANEPSSGPSGSNGAGGPSGTASDRAVTH